MGFFQQARIEEQTLTNDWSSPSRLLLTTIQPWSGRELCRIKHDNIWEFYKEVTIQYN